MSQPNPTRKSVSREEAQRRFEELIQQVTRDKIQLTVEEDGQPIAVVTPFDLHERRQARQCFLETVEDIQERANLSGEEADELAREAVAAVRDRST